MAPAAIAALYLTGCAGGMSQSECQFSDWRAVGYEDGSAGRPAGDFGRYRKSCAEQGVAADFATYQTGRDAGLKEYCQASRGYLEGLRGYRYAGVCPADTEARFLEAYNKGRTLYDLESGLRDTDNRIRANESRIKEIELELTDNGTAVLAETTTREERARLIVETKQLVEERVTLSGEIKDLQVRRQAQEKELADYRAEQVTKR
jgi:hypothetical protein